MTSLWLIPAVIQIAMVFAVVELLVRCMPSSLRTASRRNCFRVGGSRSERRTHREDRAKNRLRRDMYAVMVLVMLAGNVLYFTLDRTVAPVSSLADRAWGKLEDAPESQLVTNHREAVIEAGQQHMILDKDQFNRYWSRLAIMVALWAIISFLVVAKAAMMSYKTFATGVHARSAEYFQLDMSRMSTTEHKLMDDLLVATARIKTES